MHVKSVHQKLKLYQCNACDKNFALKGTLENHRKTVHGNRRDFRCDLCYKAFASKTNLANHFQAAHKSSITLEF